MFIVGAAAGLEVEQLAGGAGIKKFPGILVLELVEAASATAVAQRFPFLPGHFGERFGFPKGRIFGHDFNKGIESRMSTGTWLTPLLPRAGVRARNILI